MGARAGGACVCVCGVMCVARDVTKAQIAPPKPYKTYSVILYKSVFCCKNKKHVKDYPQLFKYRTFRLV